MFLENVTRITPRINIKASEKYGLKETKFPPLLDMFVSAKNMKSELCFKNFKICEVIGNWTYDLTKCKLHKYFMRKTKGKIKLGEWGLNPQHLESMRELAEK